jgi:hypothetical protein
MFDLSFIKQLLYGSNNLDQKYLQKLRNIEFTNVFDFKLSAYVLSAMLY